MKLSSSVSIFLHQLLFYFLAHLHRSQRLTDFRGLWLKRRDSAKSTSFSGCEQKIIIFSTIFRKNTRNSLFPQCKTSIGNNSGSIRIETSSLRITGGIRQLRIEWCDRHLCHVTGSDDTNRFGVKQHLECV